MQLEYVDVVFANRPDPNTPMEGNSTIVVLYRFYVPLTHLTTFSLLAHWINHLFSVSMTTAMPRLGYTNLLSLKYLFLHAACCPGASTVRMRTCILMLETFKWQSANCVWAQSHRMHLLQYQVPLWLRRSGRGRLPAFGLMRHCLGSFTVL